MFVAEVQYQKNTTAASDKYPTGEAHAQPQPGKTR
jgi:hypothetical protein